MNGKQLSHKCAGHCTTFATDMQTPTRLQGAESDEVTAQDVQNTYNSHSDLSHYQNGMYNKGFSSSKEDNLSDQMDDTITPNTGKSNTNSEICNFTKSTLPLVDSLLSYKAENFGCKTPLVPPRRSKEIQTKETLVSDRTSASDCEQTSCDNNKHDIETSDIVFYPENVDEIILARKSPIKRESRGVQAWPTPPYRLKVLPKLYDDHKFKCNLNLIGRWMFCQVGLGSILFLWALAGATAFRYTEGPREEKAAQELIVKQKHLVTNLATELREEVSDKNEWYKTIEKYMAYHEQVLAEGGNGMGQGPNGHVWTLPGCILFAVSLITTLGFGAPVPRTPEGRGVAIAFAAVGIPLHLLLVLNIGMVIAIKLQSFANKRPKIDKESQEETGNDISKTESKIVESYHKSNRIFSTNRHKRTGSEPIGRQALNNIANQTNFRIDQSKEVKYFYITEVDSIPQQRILNEIQHKTNNLNFSQQSHDSNEESKTEDETNKVKHVDSEPHIIPKWLKWLPFIGIFVYFVIGFLLFGVARYKSFLDSLMFPLDFTVAGGVAQTPGYIRVLYALYLEGAVVLTAVTVSVLQVSATQGLTNIGLKYNILTNSR
ncbi:uncharacterized protein LOC143916153 isoform X1 [Arctopsyche grandis]|uniref:uncharacterized protein LOC143916153 isoform X1 n=1 Tax=Arctopsyche grandis TaxID=121162 RepID=UPI00406D6D62